MANSVLDWVWDRSRSRHSARLVLLSLADSTRKPGGWTWPSVPELMSRTGLGARAVQAAVIELARAGELEVQYNAGPLGCNRYRVIMTPADIAPPPQTLRGADIAPPQSLRGSESSQVSEPDPAESAPPANFAPPQDLRDPPANFAPGTVSNPDPSPTEMDLRGVQGGDALFDAEPKTAAKPSGRRKATAAPDEDFERWYTAYPVHKARGDAEKAWAQVTKAGADPEVLIAAAKRYRDDPQVVRGFGKFPAGWLRAKCWLDEPTPEPQASGPANGARQVNYTPEEYASGWQ